VTPEEVGAVESAAAGSESTLDLGGALRAPFAPNDPPTTIAALILAFDYDAVGQSDVERRAQWGPFAPMIETTAGVYPPPLTEVPDDVWEYWADAAQTVSSSLVRARTNDLLWEGRRGTAPHEAARTAIAAYIEIASGLGPGSMEMADALTRALELARALNDPALVETVTRAASVSAAADLRSPDGAPGVSLGLIESIARLPATERPADLVDLLQAAWDRYFLDPWLASSIADIELSLGVDETRRRELIDRKIDAWEQAAAAADGLVATMHLEKAIEIARRHGLTEKADELRARLQEAGRSLDLQGTPIDVPIDVDAVQAFVESFVDTADLVQALGRFASHCPLPETRDESAEFVRRLMQEHPLQYLFTKVVLGPGNVPMQVVTTESEHFESALTSHEATAIELWSAFAATVLDQIHERFRPSRETVREILAGRPLTAIVAEPLSEAFELYWMGRVDAAMMTALPRVETMLRDLSQQLGLVIFAEPQADKPGKFKVLGELLRGLVGHFDERRRHYLLTALAQPLSYNLRNNALHGLTLVGSREQAAIALHCAALFVLFEVSAQEAD
jgi:hypothetical protein